MIKTRKFRIFKVSLVIFLLLLSQYAVFQFVPSAKANPEPSSNVFFDKPVDWQALWILFNSHAMWDLEWQKDVSSAWISVKSELTIVRDYPKEDTCKITLIFNASQTGNYRFTVAIDVKVKNHITRLDKYQYELWYDDFSIVFDWSDIVSISNLQITHGLTTVDGDNYFWFRIRRDNVPKGAHVELDPSIDFTLRDSETYYPSGYTLVGSTTYVSGSLTDLQSNNDVYMTFRSYASSGTPNTITFVNVGAEATGTGAVTPPLPASMQSGDICILVATTIAAGTVTITATGSITTWTAVTGSPVDVTLGEKLYVWWGRWTSGTTGPTVTPGSDHIEAGIGAWRNCIGSGSPIDVSQTGTETTSDTSFSFATSISTTVNGAMCIAICTTGTDVATNGQFTVMTDTSLTSLAERMDYETNSGGGGGFALDEGYKATAGVVGTWASTLTTASSKAYISFALKPSYSAATEYTCEVEFTGTSNTEPWTQLSWIIDSSFTTEGVTATFQLYNYQTASYPTSGDGYMTDTIGTSDVNKNQTITTNPTYFRDASGNWKIKVKGVKATSTQFDWKANFIDPVIQFTTVSVTSVHTCPLDEHTFVIAYHDETNDDFSFQIYDTNGTQVLAETDVDTTSGGTMTYTSIGVSAFNSTTFVIGWDDKTDADITFAVYNKAGTLLSGPTDVDTVGGGSYSVQVSCFNSTHFVIVWRDAYNLSAEFAVYTSSSVKVAGPTTIETTAHYVSVSAFNSTRFVVGWFDPNSFDASFRIYNSAGTAITAIIDADTDVGSSYSVSVSAFNSTYFVIGWFDATDQDVTFAVYNSAGTLKAGPTDADTAVGTASFSVQVSALNSTYFVISWYDYVDFDLSYATYTSTGTLIASNDVESWPTAANTVFRYQSPCSQETATGIKLYNDNWIIAYANTTTQAIWKAYKPDGTEWDGTIPSEEGQDLTFVKNESSNVLDGESTGKGMANLFGDVLGVFDKLFQNLARPFPLSEMTKLFDYSRMSQGLGFLESEISSMFGDGVMTKELLKLSVELVKILDYGSIGKSLANIKSELVGVLDSMTKGISVGTTFGEFGRIFDNLQATFQISGLGQQLSFLQSELISFTPIYGDPYGWLINNAWLTNNPWTVINYGISSTGGDVSLQVSMGLAKGMGEFFGLFDLGRLNFAVSNFVAVMTKIYDETLWNLARPFTMSEFSGMFDKMLSGIGKGVQFGEIGRFFDTNVLGKGLSFVKSELNNVFDRALLGLGKATVFGELGKAFDYGFMNRAIPVSFFEFSKVWDGSLIGKGMAKLSFELTRIFDYSASSKSLGISSSELARIFDLKAFGFSMGKLSGEFTYVFDSFAIGRSMSIPVLGNLLKVFDAMTSNFARSFQMFELFKVFDSSSLSRGLGFLNSEFSKLFDNLDIGKGMGLGRGEFAKVWDSQSFGKGLGFTRSELSKVFDSITMGKGLGFLKSEFSTMFDSIVVGKGMGKSFGELSKVFDNLQTVLQTVGPKALSFSFDELSEMFDDGISAIGKTSVFSELSRIFDYANMVRAVSFLQSELISFTSIYGDPYGWFVGNAWLESSPWTILSNGISSTGGDVSLQVSMSLARGMGDFFGLFDLGGLKVAVSNFMGVMTKVYDGMVQNLARPFVMSELSNVFDKLLFGVGKGVQFSEIGKVFDTNVLGKGLGFMRSELSNVLSGLLLGQGRLTVFGELARIFDNISYGKGLGLVRGELSGVWDGLSFGKGLGFTNGELSKAFDSLTMGKGLGVLKGELSRVFDSITSGKGIWTMQEELMRIFMYEATSKGLAKSFDELSKIYDSSSLGKGLGFLNGELVKVFDFGSFNKAIPFSFSELSRVFDNFAIGKSLSSLFGEFSYVFDYIRTVFQLSGPQSYVFRFYEFARGFDAIYRTVFISRGLTSLMTIFSGLSKNVIVIRNVYGSTYIYAILGRQSIFSRSVSTVVSIATSVVSRVPFAVRIIGQDILTITGLNVVSPSVVPPVVGPVLTGPSVIVTAEFIIRSTWTTGTFTCSILQLIYDNVPLTVQMEVYNKQTVPADITLKYYVTEGNYTVIINGTSYGVANIGGVRSDTIHIEANGTTVRNLVVDVPVRDNVFTFERTYAFHIFATYPNETTTEIVKQIKVSYTVIYAQVGLMISAFVILGVVFKKRKGLKKIWKALTEEVTSAQKASNRRGASSRRAASK